MQKLGMFLSLVAFIKSLNGEEEGILRNYLK
jgi:hypothetical protein